MPDFDAFYDEPDLSFGEQPSKELQAHLERIATGGKALVLGAGDGRNSLYLARLGFQVTALDTSEVGLQKLAAAAKEQGLADRVTTEVADVRQWKYPHNRYELIAAVTVFDHLERGQLRPVFNQVTDSLRHGGLLYVKVHTADDPGANKDARKESELAEAIHYYFGRNELLDLVRPAYHVIRYDEMSETDRSHGDPHQHVFAKLLARKLPLDSRDTPELGSPQPGRG